MAGIGLIMLFCIAISGMQIFLSLRKNSYPGLVIPGVNILLATIFGMMGTDYLTGYFVFTILLLPVFIWLGIYKLCRFMIDKRSKGDMKKTIIKDL